MIKQSALEYAKQGWAVIPLKPNTKRSRVFWKRFQKIRPPEFDISAWWDRWPKANIGLICGNISGHVVLDIDPRNGGEAPEGLPETLVVDTPSGGEHYYFKIPEDESGIIRSGIIGPGIDFIAEGEFVVAPPSIIDGKQYQYQHQALVADLTFMVES